MNFDQVGSYVLLWDMAGVWLAPNPHRSRSETRYAKAAAQFCGDVRLAKYPSFETKILDIVWWEYVVLTPPSFQSTAQRLQIARGSRKPSIDFKQWVTWGILLLFWGI